MEGVQDIFVVGDEIVIEDYRFTIILAIRKKYFCNCAKNCLIIHVYVKFNDDILGFDEPPIIENGSTLVPMSRFLFRANGSRC